VSLNRAPTRPSLRAYQSGPKSPSSAGVKLGKVLELGSISETNKVPFPSFATRLAVALCTGLALLLGDFGQRDLSLPISLSAPRAVPN
jgi:hypothetical protein